MGCGDSTPAWPLRISFSCRWHAHFRPLSLKVCLGFFRKAERSHSPLTAVRTGFDPLRSDGNLTDIAAVCDYSFSPHSRLRLMPRVRRMVSSKVPVSLAREWTASTVNSAPSFLAGLCFGKNASDSSAKSPHFALATLAPACCLRRVFTH